MRLVTSAKYLIGLVAASSVAMIVSGSALAAETSASNLDQIQAQGSEITAPVGGSSKASPLVSNEKSTIQLVTTGDSDIVVSGQNDSTTTSTAGQTPTTTGNSTTPTTTVSHQTSLQTGSAANGGAGTPPSANSVSGGVTVVQPSLSTIAQPTTKPVVTEQTVVEASSEAAKAGSQQTISDMHVPTVVLGEQRLPIQPVITARAAAPADLAASLPSAPTPGSEPAPAHSNGLLSTLSIGLIATLVPHVSLPAVPLAMAMQSAGILNLLVIGLFLMVSLTFGSWLRRGGYVTAARSDIADSQLVIATSRMMGYVSALPKKHNPFSVVMADTKTFSVMLVTL